MHTQGLCNHSRYTHHKRKLNQHNSPRSSHLRPIHTQRCYVLLTSHTTHLLSNDCCQHRKKGRYLCTFLLRTMLESHHLIMLD